MKASELRIGNWVQNKSEYIMIKNFDETGINFHLKIFANYLSYLDTWDRISPIELTPEILEKAGFQKQSNGSCQTDMQLGFQLWGRDGEVGAYSEYNDEIGERVRYLHQLQNLYYALTGQELTITL